MAGTEEEAAAAAAEEEHHEAQSKEKPEHRQHKSFKQGGKQGKEYECSSCSSSEEEEEEEGEEEEDDGDDGDSYSKADAKGEQKKQKRRKGMKKKKKKKQLQQQHQKEKKKKQRVRINPCLVILNLLLACVGIGFIGVGVWMALNHGTNCVHFLQTFLIGSGLFMLAIAASGIAGAIFRVLWLLYLNFIVMLLLLLLIVGTTVFVLIITGHGISASIRAEHSNSTQGSRNPLSSWIRDRVNERIRACTQNGQICNFVQYSYSTGYYSRPRLSDLQRACCEAPEGCNSNNIVGNDTAMAIESDCMAWRQAGATTGFCSHCSLCRAAVAENVRHVWHTVAIFKVITLLILLPAYFITCCNFKQDDSNGCGGGDCRQGLDCCFNVL